jgi:hydroxypyruvate reductase 1
MNLNPWKIHNPEGRFRVIVTKTLPGRRWIDILTAADCRIEVSQSTAVLDTETIKTAIGDRCDGAIGQLTEPWGKPLFESLKAAGESRTAIMP